MGRDPHADLPALLHRLVAFARTMTGDADTARDLVQEAAARALAAANVPDHPSAYRAWLFKIVRNAALDELRRRRVADRGDVPEAADLWHFEDERIARITIEQGLAALAAPHRDIIALIDIAGFGYAEAADIIGVPVGTIMSRIARARFALLAAIEASTIRTLKSHHG